MSIYVDGNPTEIALTEFDTLETVKGKAATSVKRELKSDAMDSQYNTISNLDDFIFTTTDNRMLYFECTKPPGPYFSHGDKSVSHLARSDNEKIQKYCIYYDLYAHWFCLETYNQFCSEPDDESQQFSSIFQQIMYVNTLQKDERTYASMLCCELDRYLFANKESGCLIHQPVLCGKKKNRPDGYGAKLTMDQPSQPILVYGFKEEDYETAK